MSTPRPWLPLYVADYLADTTHLDTFQSGAYLHLIMHYWINGGLPDDDRQLATITKMSYRNWRACRKILAAFFGPNWTHKRIDQELAHAAEISNKRRAAATAKAPANAPANAPTNAHTLHTSQKKDKNSSRANAPVYSDAKHELWGEGIPILVTLGVRDQQARSVVGRWLRDSGENAVAILNAIRRARDARVVEPIGWVTRALILTKERTVNGSDRERIKAEYRAGVAALGRAAEAAAQAAEACQGFAHGPPGEETVRALPAPRNWQHPNGDGRNH